MELRDGWQRALRSGSAGAAAVTAGPCTDSRCTDGITWCAGCHGWGVVNPKGKAYRIACKQLPAWAIPHGDCNGTGMRACGCRQLDAAAVATLAARPQSIAS